MTGPHDSIIGVTVEAALGRFLNAMPARFEAAVGLGRLNAVVITADPATGKATGDRAVEPVARRGRGAGGAGAAGQGPSSTRG